MCELGNRVRTRSSRYNSVQHRRRLQLGSGIGEGDWLACWLIGLLLLCGWGSRAERVLENQRPRGTKPQRPAVGAISNGQMGGRLLPCLCIWSCTCLFLSNLNATQIGHILAKPPLTASLCVAALVWALFSWNEFRFETAVLSYELLSCLLARALTPEIAS